jgi:hypothetical protein
LPTILEKLLSAMDHEKPHAMTTYGHEAVAHDSFRESTQSPIALDPLDIEYAATPSLDEAMVLDDRKEGRGESVWYVSVQEAFGENLAHLNLGEC